MENDTKKDLPLKDELKRLLPTPSVQVAWLVMAAVFVWFFWSSIQHLTRVWYSQEDYQHGFFVPIFALVLLWMRRDMIVPFTGRGNWWGLPFFGLWALMRAVAVYFNYGSLSELSILPFFAGVALFVGGWQALRWAWPAIVFLFFMIPLPGDIQGLASQWLQEKATRVSVLVVQTLSIPAVADGNVIRLTEHELEVARACSGLRMMMLFFALCVGAAFVSRRPLWERLLMVASAAPIAVAANVSRIVITAIVYEIAGRWPSVVNIETVGEITHNWAGYMMMPIGLLFLLAEMYLLSKLLIAPLHDRPLVASHVLAKNDPEATTQRVLRRRRR